MWKYEKVFGREVEVIKVEVSGYVDKTKLLIYYV